MRLICGALKRIPKSKPWSWHDPPLAQSSGLNLTAAAAPGNTGDDAKRYQEHQVRKAIEAIDEND